MMLDYKPTVRICIVTSLLALVIFYTSACSAEKVSSESSTNEDPHGGDQIHTPVVKEQQTASLEKTSAKEGDEEKLSAKEGDEVKPSAKEGDEVHIVTSYGAHLCHAGADRELFIPLSGDKCEDPVQVQLEEEKVKYLDSKNMPQDSETIAQKGRTEDRKGHSESKVTSQEYQDSPEGDDCQFSISGDLIRRSMQGLEKVLGEVEKSGVKVFEKLGGVIDQVGLSREQVMKSLDNVMDRVSESVSESKVRVIRSFDSMMDQVSASKIKMMEEIDSVIDKVTHSKVIEEIRALQGEIRESFVLSVRNRSYVAAGVMVAITTAILVAGAFYYTWCHQEAWSYHRVSVDESTSQNGAMKVIHNPVSGSDPQLVASSAPAVGVSNGHVGAGDDNNEGCDETEAQDDHSYKAENSSRTSVVAVESKDKELMSGHLEAFPDEHTEDLFPVPHSHTPEQDVHLQEDNLKEISREVMQDKSNHQKDEPREYIFEGNTSEVTVSHPDSHKSQVLDISQDLIISDSVPENQDSIIVDNKHPLDVSNSINVKNISPGSHNFRDILGKGDEKASYLHSGTESFKVGIDGCRGEGGRLYEDEGMKLRVTENIPIPSLNQLR